MNQKDKELLKSEILSRTPYGVKVKVNEYVYTVNEDNPLGKYTLCGAFGVTDWKPYLRSFNSLSESELEEYNRLKEDLEASAIVPWKCFKFLNWCYKHHLDINGLIEMGLAIEAPEGMYK